MGSPVTIFRRVERPQSTKKRPGIASHEHTGATVSIVALVALHMREAHAHAIGPPRQAA